MTGLKHFLAFIAAVLLLASCGEKKDITYREDTFPADSLISPDKMVLILTDVHVVEAALLLERNEGKESKEKPGFYYQGIFAKYHVSQQRYDENLRLYRQNPAAMIKIYEKVITMLEERKKKTGTAK